VIGGVIGYQLLQTSNSNEYLSKIEAQRVKKDIWFSNDFDSPFLKTNTPFHRLDYFLPSQNYIIKAKFKKSSTQDSVHLITSTGENQSLLIYGKASFTFQEQDVTLLLLYIEGDNELFVPFIDATSGHASYGAGRYLETEIPTGKEVILDFNIAYNPYCAYVDNYSCPFPPKENVLSIAIEAGEKNYHH
jgi:uncharacterized protein (DUF1684 family)